MFYTLKTTNGFILNIDTFTKNGSGFKNDEIEFITCEKALISPPKNMDTVNLSTSQLKYEALLKNKRNYSFALDEVRKIGRNMLYDGATAFYETELGAYDPFAGSLCHGWSPVPIYVYEDIKNIDYNLMIEFVRNEEVENFIDDVKTLKRGVS